MLETYFSASKMLGHLRSGPSGPYLDGFAAALERQGYSAGTAVRYLRAAAHLGYVVARQGAMPSGDHLGRRLRQRRRPRHKTPLERDRVEPGQDDAQLVVRGRAVGEASKAPQE